ncbi:MAG: hypothetical protein HFI00_17340 [Lachnospiraceae bacterium]|nr:hypothetical protein [Lachnospiraceae bacterium]
MRIIRLSFKRLNRDVHLTESDLQTCSKERVNLPAKKTINDWKQEI